MMALAQNGAATMGLKELAAVYWDSHGVGVGTPKGGEGFSAVLRTFEGDGIEKIGVAELHVPLEPFVSRLLGADGSVILVQTFRMSWPGFGPRRLTWCAGCGDTQAVDVVELGRRGHHACRKCEAWLSPVGCVAGHTYGRCAACELGKGVEAVR